jgi:hypothetical protein
MHVPETAPYHTAGKYCTKQGIVTFAAGAGGGLGGATGTGLGSSFEPKLGTCTFSNFGASNLGIWKGSDGFSGAAAGAGVGGGVLGPAGLCAFSGS